MSYNFLRSLLLLPLMALALHTGVIEAKVLLITHSYNRPDFIELQAKTFQKFLQDDYEFVVFNDAPTQKLAEQVEAACAKLGISCFRVPQSIHQQPYLPREADDDWNSPSIRTANAVQYSFDTLAFQHDGMVAIIDSDMFLIRNFSIVEYASGYDLAAVAQWRGSDGVVKYLWNGIMFFNMQTLPNKRSLNFNCGRIMGNCTDTGGFTHYYLKQNPEAKVRFMREQLDVTDGDYIVNSYEPEGRDYMTQEEVLAAIQSYEHLPWLLEQKPDDIQFFLHCTILHYRRAGNYHHKPNVYHQKKTKILHEFIERILQ